MYRTIVYLALVAVTFCVLGIIVPQSFSSLTFLLPDGANAILNLLLAILLMHFGLAAYFRSGRYKKVFGIFGALWAIVAVLGLLHPTYFGLFAHYMRPANIAMMLIVGVGSLVAALEYNRPSLAEEFKLLYVAYVLQDLEHISPTTSAQPVPA